MKNKTIRKAIYSLDSVDEFCQNIKNALDRKIINRTSIMDRLIRKNILHEAFPPSSPIQTGGAIPSAGIVDPNVTPKDAELVLDPEFEKEYYMDDDEFDGHYIIYKKIGLGMAKPIRVYIDNKPWEIFTTLKFARKITKEYISSGRIDKDKKQSEEEAEDKTKDTHDGMIKQAEVQAKIAKKFDTDKPEDKTKETKTSINKVEEKDKKESEKK